MVFVVQQFSLRFFVSFHDHLGIISLYNSRDSARLSGKFKSGDTVFAWGRVVQNFIFVRFSKSRASKQKKYFLSD